MSEELHCQWCGKVSTTKSGLTNHMKVCSKAPASVPPSDRVAADRVAVVGDDYSGYEEFDDPDPRDVDPRGGGGHQVQPRKNGANQFSVGAFFVLDDYMPILLDLNFCAALSEFILSNGSNNKAIMAFGHKLRQSVGD